MTISWAYAEPADLRLHHARDAAEKVGDPPTDVMETVLPADGAFRGGLLFTPTNASRHAAIIYFHGGGFVAGSPVTHRCVTAWLAKLTGIPVLSARYSLAPEHPYPAQQADGIAALVMAMKLCGAPAVFLAGDSAGACIALWTWRGLSTEQRTGIKGLALFYGGYGHIMGDSITRHGTPENGLDATTLAIMYRRLGDGDLVNAPIWPKDFAPDITAPAYVLAAELDAIFDDSAKLYRDMRAHSTDTTFVLATGQDHGFLKSIGKNPLAMQALEKAAQWIVDLDRQRHGP